MKSIARISVLNHKLVCIQNNTRSVRPLGKHDINMLWRQEHHRIDFSYLPNRDVFMEDVAHTVKKYSTWLLPPEWLSKLIRPESYAAQKRLLIFRLTHAGQSFMHDLRITCTA